jgi:hypothetical protein
LEESEELQLSVNNAKAATSKFFRIMMCVEDFF